jgi:mutator protein MutT
MAPSDPSAAFASAGWLVTGDDARAAYRASSLLTAGQFVQAVVVLAADLDRSPHIDLRPDGVTVGLAGIGEDPAGHLEFARQVCALASELDLPVERTPPAPAHPVSVKGVVVHEGRLLLLLNERDEWELPGGRLERGETPQQCLRREVFEEVGWHVDVGPLLDAWVYEVLPRRRVLIVTYACSTAAGLPSPRVSDEHRRAALFAVGDLDGLPLPDGYRRSIGAVLRGTMAG